MEAGKLSARLAQLAPAVDLAEELPQLLSLASSDPKTSLTKARVILERLLKSVAEFEGVVMPDNAMVGALLSPMFDLRARLPVVPLAEMEYVNRVASSGGPHHGQADTPSALRVLEHLCCAVEWYAHEYLPAGLRDNFDVPLKAGESLVAYVSSGGTCRCAIANVVTRQYLTTERVRAMSLALHQPTSGLISPDAVRVLRDELGVDVADHRTIRANERYFRRASLFLAMDEKLLKQLPASASQRAFLFSEFYGGRGGIDDPFGRGLEAYRACFWAIEPLIAQGNHMLTAWVEDH